MHDHFHRSAPLSRHRAPPTPAATHPAGAALDAGRMLELQRLAGNAGVLRVLQRDEKGTEDDDDT